MKTSRQQVALLMGSLETLSDFVKSMITEHERTAPVQEGLALIARGEGKLHVNLTANAHGEIDRLSIGITSSVDPVLVGCTPRQKEIQHVFRNPETLEIETVEKIIYNGADVAKSFSMIVIDLRGEEMEGARGPEN